MLRPWRLARFVSFAAASPSSCRTTNWAMFTTSERRHLFGTPGPHKIGAMRAIRVLACLAAVFGTGVGLVGQSPKPDPSGVIHVTPADVKFAGGAAMESVVLAGDPNKPGIYVI